MSVQTLSSAEFEDFIKNNELIFMDFWAEWCAPCKQFAKIYERIAEQHKNIKFVKVNVEEEKDLAEVFQIRSIPHLLIFKQGIVIYSEAGAMPESVLKDLVEQALKADVSAIREKIDKGEI